MRISSNYHTIGVLETGRLGRKWFYKFRLTEGVALKKLRLEPRGTRRSRQTGRHHEGNVDQRHYELPTQINKNTVNDCGSTGLGQAWIEGGARWEGGNPFHDLMLIAATCHTICQTSVTATVSSPVLHRQSGVGKGGRGGRVVGLVRMYSESLVEVPGLRSETGHC